MIDIGGARQRVGSLFGGHLWVSCPGNGGRTGAGGVLLPMAMPGNVRRFMRVICPLATVPLVYMAHRDCSEAWFLTMKRSIFVDDFHAPT